MNDTRRITMELKEQIAVLAERNNGWTKELNLVSWNGNPPKFDIRDWDQEHAKVSRGLTLFDDEMHRLVDGYLRYRNQKVVANGHPYRDAKEAMGAPEVEAAMAPGLQSVAACANAPEGYEGENTGVDTFEAPASAAE